MELHLNDSLDFYYEIILLFEYEIILFFLFFLSSGAL